MTIRIFILFAASLIVGCSNDYKTIDLDIGIESDLNLPAEYSYQIQLSCFCASSYLGPHYLRINDGRIVEYKNLFPDGQSNMVDSTVIRTFTIAYISNLVLEVQNGNSGTVSGLEYNNQYNFPIKGYIDQITNAVDDELGFEITDFREL